MLLLVHWIVVTDWCLQIWALDSEGEINGVYRDGDVAGLYIMMGELLVFIRDISWADEIFR